MQKEYVYTIISSFNVNLFIITFIIVCIDEANPKTSMDNTS